MTFAGIALVKLETYGQIFSSFNPSSSLATGDWEEFQALNIQ